MLRSVHTNLKTAVGDLQHRAPVLVLTTVLSLALFGVAAIGLLIDPRELLSAPIWLKPLKFGLSGAVYLGALAWMVRDLPTSRVTRIAVAVIGWLIVGETALVLMQAARGRQSHFNIDTPLDGAIFSAMGMGIAVVWLLSMVILVQHLRSPARDRAMAMAFRIGLALNIVGAAVGWKMVQPQPAQIAAITQGTHPFRVGSHTVGASDGGRGLPFTNWSRTNGDLRIPHFIGLHSLQLLPLLVLLLRTMRRRRDDAIERNLLTLTAGACAATFVMALWQALDGQPLLPPS